MSTLVNLAPGIKSRLPRHHEMFPRTNGPYAYLCKTSKFHHQISFVNKIRRICTKRMGILFNSNVLGI